ncbi:MAG: NADH-quinone oxidoreductase subunit J [Roseiflexaceae bacterium]|nr:NADH-quinone oxidoreductase subunit J [Roseiflexaceae bacterium]
MELVVFIITAVIAITGAIAMLLSKNAVHSALFLLLNFAAIAVLYLLLRAPFLFAVQLIVYAGAIIVLFLFVVMLLGAERSEDDHDLLANWQRPLALGLAAALVVEAGYVLFRSRTLAVMSPTSDDLFAEPEKIAAALFTKYLLPFEITGFILLAAVAGVVVLHMQSQQTSSQA